MNKRADEVRAQEAVKVDGRYREIVDRERVTDNWMSFTLRGGGKVSHEVYEEVTSASPEELRQEAITFLRNTIAQSPEFAGAFAVVNIDVVNKTTMVFDLDDGTTIRLDISRYVRED